MVPDALCAADPPACGAGWSWVVRGKEVSSAKASRHGVIAPLIVEKEAGPLGGVFVESLGDLPLSTGR